jgi:subtilisin family serine protease
MKVRLLGAVLITGLVLGLSLAESPGPKYIVVLKGSGSIGAVNNVHGTKTLHQIDSTPVYLVQAGSPDSNGQTLQQLKTDGAVESAEPNADVMLRKPSDAPLDPRLVQQMASLLDGQTMTTFYGTTVLRSYVNQPAVAITHVSDVRNLSTGAGTHIAYIDTGVDFNHPALAPWLDSGIDVLHETSASELDGLSQQMASLLDQQMASLLDGGFNFVLDQAMASLLDENGQGGSFPPDLGHGTLVAGVLHLVAPGARIVPIKAFDLYGHTTMFAITEAVYQATHMGVDVLNMSFSTTQDSAAFRKAISAARAAGIVVVASVGNDANNTVSYFPAAYANVIGVAATDFRDRLASFSNYGKAVSVDAPGAYVVSTAPGGRYAAAWGTSFSAPMVAGEIALLASSRGQGYLDPSLVVNTADSIDALNPSYAGMLGKGRINALRAMRYAR